jgi:hypothetical protein
MHEPVAEPAEDPVDRVVLEPIFAASIATIIAPSRAE